MTSGTESPRPRIALIHALEESIAPIRSAFRENWPEAFTFDLLDTSLAPDRAHSGVLDEAMTARFATLGDYAAGTSGVAGPTRALLFTCSAFGPAIDKVKSRVPIPVLRPNESAFEIALGMGGDIGLAVTFPPSESSLRAELEEMAQAAGRKVRVQTTVAAGALDALKAGNPALHDELAARAVETLGNVAVVVLGQFSLARAAPLVRSRVAVPVLTTPDCAVRALKSLVNALPATGAAPGRAKTESFPT
jgi:Asp/Glu/hydantoin racemase